MRPGRTILYFAGTLVLLLAAFFGTALRNYGEVHYSSADLSRTSSWTSVEPGRRATNQLLSDPYTQMEPWSLFDAEEIRAGRFPLWNPWNGGGQPQFANEQSAVLSPFSLPFYGLSPRAALLVAAAAKLACAGLFLFLFLRAIGCGAVAAAFGAVTYAFCGYQVVLLRYPHVGVAALAPAALFVLERAIQAFERERRLGRSTSAWLAGLVVTLALGAFAGHPEALAFVALFVAAYAAWRIVGIARAGTRTRPLIVAVIAVHVAALGFAAIQIVPFAEYLGASQVLNDRASSSVSLLARNWPLSFFPDLLGNPSSDYVVSESLPAPNYEGANSTYCGALALFLAAASLWWVRTNRCVRFFAGAWVVWFVLAYDVLGAGRLFERIPLLGLAPLDRSQHACQLALAALAALGLDALLRARPTRMGAAALVVGATAAFALYWAGAGAMVDSVQRTLTDAQTKELIGERSHAHVIWIGWTFALGCVAAASAFASHRARAGLASIAVLAAFLQTGWLMRDYNPVCPDAEFYPRTEHVDTLGETIGADRVVIFGTDTLPPGTNIVHRVAMLSAYDALWVQRYDQLYRALFGETDNWRLSIRASERALRMFGVRWLVTRMGWLPVSTAYAESPPRAAASRTTEDITADKPVVQEFTGLAHRFTGLSVWFTAASAASTCTLRIRLEDVASQDVVFDRICRADMLKVGPSGGCRATYRFDPIQDSEGRAYRLTVSTTEADAGAGAQLLARRDLALFTNQALWRTTRLRTGTIPRRETERHPDLDLWRCAQGGEPIEGGLAFDITFARDAFTDTGRIGDFHVFRYEESLGRFFGVDAAVSARDDADALARVLHTDFDPGRQVVISGGAFKELEPSPSPGYTVNTARVVSDVPTRVEVEVEREQEGWLVATDAWFPGWIAEVDGVERPLWRANYAFRAVPVPAGKHRVVFRYEPLSFVIGAWITTLTAVLTIGAVFVARRRANIGSIPGA